MKAAEVLMSLRARLEIAIDSHEAAMKRATDTGVMWRLAAYREIRNLLDKLEAQP